MWDEAKQSRARAKASVDRARYNVTEQAIFIAAMTGTDPRLEGARKLLRQMEQSLASAELSLAICGYDDDALDARMEAFKSGKA